MKKVIKILGVGCSRCNTLAEVVAEVLREQGIEAEMEKIDDIEQIMKYNVMTTPGLVINEKVVSSGRVPSKDEIRSYIEGNDLI